MIDRNHPLPIKRQATLAGISRGTVYYRAQPVSQCDLALMRRMGLCALYRKPSTSGKNPAHPVFPYLLRALPIERANQVWALDITYIPMARGWVYLVAVLDWHSRKVLAHRVSITMAADFCIDALCQAAAEHGAPRIVNTDRWGELNNGIFPA